LEDADAAWNMPTAQLTHSEDFAAEYWPGTQDEHDASPLADCTLPAPQFVHTDSPDTEVAVPGPHFVHTVAPAAAAIDPIGHSVQLVLPVSELKRPALH